MSRVAAIILCVSIAACTGSAAAPAGDRPLPPRVQSAAAGALAPAAPPPDPQVSGVVVETMDAGPYTYVRLKTAGGEVWAAVTQAALKTGSEVTIGDAMWMENFESKMLKRKFDHILFGAVMTLGSAPANELPPGHPPAAEAASSPAPHRAVASASADVGDVKVDKAPGKDGRTVAEIFAAKALLKGVEVVVRGRVVKWNAEIMGRNWIHLRDGSGSADKQDNDITVTTTDLAAKGDIITVRGKIAIDKDFGAGYAYTVIIEDAKVIK